MRRTLITVIVLVWCVGFLGGCAVRTWGKAGAGGAEGEQVMSMCKDEADRGSRVSYFVMGDAAMVAGAVIGSEIGRIVAYRRVFDGCMERNGYQVVE